MTKRLEDYIQKANHRRLILGSVLLLILVILFASFSKYLFNFAFGPFEAKISDLINAEEANDIYRYFITVKGKKIYDTGFQHVTTNENGVDIIDEYYLALDLGPKFILIESYEIPTSNEVTGFLKPIPTNIQEEVLDQVYQENPGLRGYFLPYMIKVDNFRMAGWVGITAGSLTLVLALLLFIRGLSQLNHPEKHPIIQRLVAFGDPNKLVLEIDDELTTGSEIGKNLVLTEHWLLHYRGTRIDVTRFDDIVWVYKQVLQHRTNGVPTHESHFAHIHDRYGNLINVLGVEKEVDAWLTEISTRSPRALKGYSKELAALYKKDPQEFATLIHQN